MTETIEETFVKVGEVETSLLTLGKLGIGLDGNTTQEKRFLFLIIPGITTRIVQGNYNSEIHQMCVGLVNCNIKGFTIALSSVL